MKSRWKKGCIIYCILAVPGLLMMYGIYYIMSNHSDERVKKVQDFDGPDEVQAAPFGLSDDEEPLPQADPDHTPERHAIKVGDNGGKFETLESGEEAYTFPSGEYARSQWVKDGDKLYYVDVSGCKMKNNYAHDGFYVGNDGAWDKTVRSIDTNALPQNGAAYVDDGGKTWVFQLTTDADGTIHGKAHLAYPKDVGFEADYTVKSFGKSAYSLFNIEDEFECWHVVVIDGGRTLRVSGAGVTEVYHKK